MSDWKSRISFGFFLLITIGSIGSYWIVDRVTNSQAPTKVFGGWDSLLEPQAEFAGKDRIWFQLRTAQSGDLSENPSVVLNIVVCGDAAFHGAVLLGGDARLSNPEVAVAKVTASGVAFDWKATPSHTGAGSF